MITRFVHDSGGPLLRAGRFAAETTAAWNPDVCGLHRAWMQDDGLTILQRRDGVEAWHIRAGSRPG